MLKATSLLRAPLRESEVPAAATGGVQKASQSTRWAHLEEHQVHGEGTLKLADHKHTAESGAKKHATSILNCPQESKTTPCQ